MIVAPPSPDPRGDAASAGETEDVEVEIDDEAWLAVLPDAVALVRQAAGAALAKAVPGADAGGEVVVLLTDDASLRDLNLRFRGRDAPTNVLAFPAAPPPAGASPTGRPLGDIAVALGVCQVEARAQTKPLADHLRHLVAHGVLHLLGHDHQDEDEALVMEGLERRLLAGIGVPDPYAGDRLPGPRALDPGAPGDDDGEALEPAAKGAPSHVA